MVCCCCVPKTKQNKKSKKGNTDFLLPLPKGTKKRSKIEIICNCEAVEIASQNNGKSSGMIPELDISLVL